MQKKIYSKTQHSRNNLKKLLASQMLLSLNCMNRIFSAYFFHAQNSFLYKRRLFIFRYLYKFNMSRESYLQALRNYISINRDVISALNGIGHNMEQNRKGERVVKTVGTTCGVVSAVSMIGILLAPVTGGLSLGLSVVAVGAAAGGVTAAVGVGVRSHFINKSYGKNIKVQQQRHELAVAQLNEEIKKIRTIIDQLTNQGYSAEVATTATLSCLANNIFNVGKGVKDILSATKTVDMFIKSQKLTSLLANSGLTLTTRLSIDGTRGYSVTFASMNALNSATEAQIQAASTLARNPNLFALGTAAVRTLAVAGVIFSVVDVAFLIKDWSDPTPLQKTVIDFVYKLEQDLTAKQNQILWIEALTNN